MTVTSTADIARLATIPRERVLCVDTETTGLDFGCDEIVQVSVVDGTGRVLMDELVRPERRRSWPEAQRVNGISPEMVMGKPRLSALKGRIEGLLGSAEVLVAYNAPFDIGMLEAGGIAVPADLKVFDVMVEYSSVYGRHDTRHHDRRWARLVDAGRHYGFDVDGAHDATFDARLTVGVMYALLSDERYSGVRAAAWRPEAGRPRGRVRGLVWIAFGVLLVLCGLSPTTARYGLRTVVIELAMGAGCIALGMAARRRGDGSRGVMASCESNETPARNHFAGVSKCPPARFSGADGDDAGTPATRPIRTQWGSR